MFTVVYEQGLLVVVHAPIGQECRSRLFILALEEESEVSFGAVLVVFTNYVHFSILVGINQVNLVAIIATEGILCERASVKFTSINFKFSGLFFKGNISLRLINLVSKFNFAVPLMAN